MQVKCSSKFFTGNDSLHLYDTTTQSLLLPTIYNLMRRFKNREKSYPSLPTLKVAEVGFEPSNLTPEPAQGTDRRVTSHERENPGWNQLEELVPLTLASSPATLLYLVPEVVCVLG